MRYYLALLVFLFLDSCAGSIGISGLLIKTYMIGKESTIRLIAASSQPYTYDLSNQSSTDVVLYLKTVGSTSITLKKGEKIEIIQESLDGIEIENVSDEMGAVKLSVHLKNQQLKLPEAVIIKKVSDN